MIRPSCVLLYDSSAGAYVDLTSYIASNTSFNFIDDASDIIYIGCDRRVIGIYSDLSSHGSYAGLTYKTTSGDGTWSNINLIDNYSFSESKYCRWLLPLSWARVQFTSTFPHAAVPPTNVEYYWIKISVTGVTAAAIISKLRMLPYASYTTSDKVSSFLQTKVKFDEGTIPTDLDVENIIRRQEDYINYRTKKSWKLTAVTEDTDPVLVDYSRYGFYLRHRNFLKVYSVKLWNGSDWQLLVEGRNQDYHINYDLGMIMVSRMFTIPAIYGMVGRYSQWGQGGFKNSIQVDYVYGRDPETDSEFYVVEDIATKLAAKDLLQHADFSHLIVSGTDKVPMESKIRQLAEDTEAKIDSLTGIVLY